MKKKSAKAAKTYKPDPTFAPVVDAKAHVDALVAGGAGARFEPMPGRAMKEWVVVKAGAADWIELANEAYRFVKRL